jgi:AbiTii-like protein
MELIGNIINELIEAERSLVTPLLKTKYLATKLKNNELLQWVNNELGGYTGKAELPPYRKYPAFVSGTYLNGSYQFRNQPIPLHGISADMEKWYNSIEFYQSVETLELFKINDKSGKIIGALTTDLIGLLEIGLKTTGNPYIQILDAQKWTSISCVTEVLSAVRSKLLDFMLKIDEEFCNITEIEDLRTNNKRITSIMNQTIITSGDGNVLNTGNNVNITANINVKKGDQKALRKALLQNGANEKDIADLISVIDAEMPKKDDGKFGEKVNTVIAKMINNAINGSWKIGIGDAGNLLAHTLQSYYGLK